MRFTHEQIKAHLDWLRIGNKHSEGVVEQMLLKLGEQKNQRGGH